MSGDGKKRNPWRGEPPPVPSGGQRLCDTLDMEAVEVDPNLDFATGPRKPGPVPPPIGAPPIDGEQPPPDPPAPAVVEEEPEPLEFASRLEDSEMDMTPMIDIVFQLLIFFMVTAAFSMQKSKEMPAPKDDTPSSNAVPELENTSTVTVWVNSYNTFRVVTTDWEEEAPSEQDLLIKLRRARNDGQSDGKYANHMMVKAHGDALHEKVIMALDAGSAVGMEQIQLQTVESDDE